MAGDRQFFTGGLGSVLREGVKRLPGFGPWDDQRKEVREYWRKLAAADEEARRPEPRPEPPACEKHPDWDPPRRPGQPPPPPKGRVRTA